MSRLRSVEQIIRPILENSKEARNDDMYLYLLLCKYCASKELGMEQIPIEVLIRFHRQLNIPCFESVRRARQKLQASNPKIGCSPEVRRARMRTQKAYRAYALDID